MSFSKIFDCKDKLISQTVINLEEWQDQKTVNSALAGRNPLLRHITGQQQLQIILIVAANDTTLLHQAKAAVGVDMPAVMMILCLCPESGSSILQCHHLPTVMVAVLIRSCTGTSAQKGKVAEEQKQQVI